MIAVLGATGYVGSSIARELSCRPEALHLFSRDPTSLAAQAWPPGVTIAPLAAFSATDHDLVINAIGAGEPARVSSLGHEILAITRFWDEHVLATMSSSTRYVFLSSGAVYGDSDQLARAGKPLPIPEGGSSNVPPYTLAKLYAEAGHRQAPDQPILDLRVFAYADWSIGLDGRFFLAELARSLVDRTPFRTTSAEMVRDYAGAAELLQLIDLWRAAGAPNRAFDLYTLMPVAKSELLAILSADYGLEIEIVDTAMPSTAGRGSIYAPTFRGAEEVGYRPRRTSAEVVMHALTKRLALVG